MTVMTGRVGGLSFNAASNWMSAANARVNLASAPQNSNSAVLLSADKQLQANMLNDSLAFKAREQQHAGLKRLQSENIKRTFSTFA